MNYPISQKKGPFSNEVKASWSEKRAKSAIKFNNMRTLITVVMCLFFSLSYSQEKNVDLNAMQAKLASVQADIAILKEKIETIQGRLEGVPETEIPEEKQNVIADLNTKLEMLRRVEFSASEFLKGQESKNTKNSSNQIH